MIFWKTDIEHYFNHMSTATSAEQQLSGAQTVWASPPAVLVHVCAASAKCRKGLGEGEYSADGVVKNKYTLSQSHHLIL